MMPVSPFDATPELTNAPTVLVSWAYAKGKFISQYLPLPKDDGVAVVCANEISPIDNQLHLNVGGVTDESISAEKWIQPAFVVNPQSSQVIPKFRKKLLFSWKINKFLELVETVFYWYTFMTTLRQK